MLFIQECTFMQEDTVLAADKSEESLFCFEPQDVWNYFSVPSILSAQENQKTALLSLYIQNYNQKPCYN